MICTLSQSDAKGKENIIQSLTSKIQDVSDQDLQKTRTEPGQVHFIALTVLFLLGNKLHILNHV